MLTANEGFFIAAGALFGYFAGGVWWALIGGVLGYAMLYGCQWVIDHGATGIEHQDDGNTFVGPPPEE